MQIINDLIVWTKDTFAPLGATGLFILAFIEASFFPIPPDLLLMILVLAKPSSWIFFAVITTIGSVLGAFLGYGIGYGGKKAVLVRFVNEERIEKVTKLFSRYDAWAIFVAGFTPIPYKVFTIAAGVFSIDLRRFGLASVLSRGTRFFLVSFVIALWGESMIIFINDYFDILSIAVVVIGTIAWVFVSRLRKRSGIRIKRKANARGNLKRHKIKEPVDEKITNHLKNKKIRK